MFNFIFYCHFINWIKNVWSSKYSPNLKKFIWSSVQKTLLVTSRGEPKKKEYCYEFDLCHCGLEETTSHMFFSRIFAQQVWSMIPLASVVHMATLEDIMEAVVQFGKTIYVFHRRQYKLDTRSSYFGSREGSFFNIGTNEL